jgi:Uma2 family endonuclease
MRLAIRSEGLSVEDYLAGEEASDVKHEYFGGAVYAMAGATKEHNLIAGNIYASFHRTLRGGPCRPFFGDVKVRLKIMEDDVFYYPDVVVGCDPRDTHRLYLCFPKVIVEVLSENTERLDRQEKRWNFQTIETLEEYILVAQNRMEVTVFRRATRWQAQVHTQPEQKVEFKSLKLKIPVATIYAGIEVGARKSK